MSTNISLTPSSSSPVQQKKERQSNIELLRILAMCGVVILHYNSIGGGFEHVPTGSLNETILYSLEGLFICAVDLFLLITGYFSCTSQRRDPIKILSLILQVIVFRFAGRLYDSFQTGVFSVRTLLGSFLPDNYFVILYAVLYVVSPYINLMLARLSRTQLKKLLVFSLLLFSLWPTLIEAFGAVTGETFFGLNTVGTLGSAQGYTIVNFALMYLIGACLRLLDVHVKKRYSLALLIVCAGVLAIWGAGKDITGVARSYCNPLVIAEAVFAFLLFEQMHFSSKIINTLSKAAFTCFLFHSLVLGVFRIPQAVQGSPIYLIAHILLTCAVIYLTSWVLSLLYDFVSKPILRLAGIVCQKIGLDFSAEDLQAPQ